MLRNANRIKVMTGDVMQGDKNRIPCFLVLEDGSTLKGESFGAKRPIGGEVGR